MRNTVKAHARAVLGESSSASHLSASIQTLFWHVSKNREANQPCPTQIMVNVKSLTARSRAILCLVLALATTSILPIASAIQPIQKSSKAWGFRNYCVLTKGSLSKLSPSECTAVKYGAENTKYAN